VLQFWYNTDQRTAQLYNTDQRTAQSYNTDQRTAQLYNIDQRTAQLYNTDQRTAQWYNTDQRTAQLYNTDQRTAQFDKLIFNFCCLAHVSNFLDSSSGRQFYMQYGIFYMHPIHQTAHTDACKIYRPAYTFVSLRMNPGGFKTCGRQQKLNIKY
jgi:hypothetical protein